MNYPLATSILACAVGLSSAQAIDLSITDQGALGDGTTVNTLAIQKTIDAVASQGGGKVIVPAGKFVTGTLHLKSHVQLYLAGNAELLGSRSLVDYPKTNPGSGEVLAADGKFDPTGQVLTASEFNGALIVADQQVNVSIAGPGTIDGRGQPDAFPVRIIDPVTGKKKLGDRPMLMRFYKTKDIRFDQVTLKNAAAWGVHLVDCDDVYFQGVTIFNRANENNDGIDLDGCRNVSIADCKLTTGDDAICPKSSQDKITENVFIRNCVISSHTAGLKLGTSSRAGFRNIIMSDCVIKDTQMGAIKLQCVDGGIVENILIQNIVMDGVEGPLFIRLGDRGAKYLTPTADGGPVPVGTLRNITISNIRATVTTADSARSGIMITGIPGHKISGVRLDNIDIRFPGFGPAPVNPAPVPEDAKRYPEQFFFKGLPSYGIYVRHAEDIELSRIRFSYTGEEKRPAIVLDDVNGFALKDSRIQADGAAVLSATQSSGVSLTGCTINGAPQSLLGLDKTVTDTVYLSGNRLPATIQ